MTVSVAANGDSATCVVADTGIGIPSDEQGQIFSRFFRASTATQRAIPGTGLGLAISRALVEQHGGTISLESREGEGTRVTMTLPAQRPEQGIHARRPDEARCRRVTTPRRLLPPLVCVAAALVLGGATARALPVPGAPHCTIFPANNAVEPARRLAAGRRRLGAADRVDRALHRAAPRLRLRPLRRRADRHPVRRRLEVDAAVARHVRLRRRVGQGPVSDPEDGAHRGRQRVVGRPARAPDRQGRVPALRAVRALPEAGRRLEGRARARSGACARTSCGRQAGRPPTRRACRSSRGSRATTRSRAA